VADATKTIYERGGGPGAAAKIESTNPAEFGTLKGRIVFGGAAPRAGRMEIKGDPICVRAHPDGLPYENFVVGKEGGIQWAFVYLAPELLSGAKFATPTETMVVDQKGCVYTPHVFGVMLNQPVRIKNSDPTLHNVHGITNRNGEFNIAQPAGAADLNVTFGKAEIGMVVKCEVHGWMRAYACALPHPFFAVTDADGNFTMSVPPGEFSLTVWHEELGTRPQTETIRIGKNESKTLTITLEPQ